MPNYRKRRVRRPRGDHGELWLYYVGYIGGVVTFYDYSDGTYAYKYWHFEMKEEDDGKHQRPVYSDPVTGFASRKEAEAHGFWAWADEFAGGTFPVDQDDRDWTPHPRPIAREVQHDPQV